MNADRNSTVCISMTGELQKRMKHTSSGVSYSTMPQPLDLPVRGTTSCQALHSVMGGQDVRALTDFLEQEIRL